MKILVVGWQALPDVELIPFLGALRPTARDDDPLIEGGVVWFWCKALREMGHEVRFFDHAWPRLLPRARLVGEPDIFHDLVIARMGDHSIAERDAGIMNQKLLEAAHAFRPDRILTHQAERVTAATLAALREIAPTGTWIGCNPTNTSRTGWMESLHHYDHAFCAIRDIMPKLAASGVRTHYLSFAFDPSVHQPIDDQKECELGMVGTSKYPRRRLLRRLARDLPALRIGIWGRGWPVDSLLDRFQRGFAWHRDLARAIAGMVLHFNAPHVSVGEEINMRCFETTGCGTPLLTLRQEGLAEHFETDREVIVYDGADDLVEKVRYFSTHAEEAAAIGAAGRKRALAGYTYQHRLGFILERMAP